MIFFHVFECLVGLLLWQSTLVSSQSLQSTLVSSAASRQSALSALSKEDSGEKETSEEEETGEEETGEEETGEEETGEEETGEEESGEEELEQKRVPIFPIRGGVNSEKHWETWDQEVAKRLRKSRRSTDGGADGAEFGQFLGVDLPAFNISMPKAYKNPDTIFNSQYDHDLGQYRAVKSLAFFSYGPPSSSREKVGCGLDLGSQESGAGRSKVSGGMIAENGNDLERRAEKIEEMFRQSRVFDSENANENRGVGENLGVSDANTSFLLDRMTSNTSSSSSGNNTIPGANKFLVVPFDWPEAGYFGHLMVNGFSRLAFLAGGAKLAGYRVVVYVPAGETPHGPESMGHVRQILKEVFNEALYIDLWDKLPEVCRSSRSSSGRSDDDDDESCRFAYLCDLPSWHEESYRRFYLYGQAAVARWQQKEEDIPRTEGGSGIFIARGGKDTYNDHGMEQWASEVKTQLRSKPATWTVLGGGGGEQEETEIHIPMSDIPISRIATMVSRSNVVAGCQGTGMFHMIWLVTPLSPLWPRAPPSSSSPISSLSSTKAVSSTDSTSSSNIDSNSSRLSPGAWTIMPEDFPHMDEIWLIAHSIGARYRLYDGPMPRTSEAILQDIGNFLNGPSSWGMEVAV
eukprot:TRINITY_DN11329_c0_g1_i3.p1 TRINITY_DN11329_c0_g1~~TRINITY_DN11329_c0_g1_i3.p1  ORF type:complete len:630 (-),score=55.37 TRINITY_DN11329_c0_g1_i3:325-2214(-)